MLLRDLRLHIHLEQQRTIRYLTSREQGRTHNGCALSGGFAERNGVIGGDPRAAWHAAFHDGRAHPSPNAGRVEGAFAGALGIRLGGLNRYRHGAELRATLGQGPAPTVLDIDRAVRLARLVDVTALVLCVALARRRR